MWLVVGLGNPGREYAATRHNIGFMVADELARRYGLQAWKAKFGGEVLQKEQTVILKPQEYMNVSGPVVQRCAGFYKVETANIIVIHDEIDLDFGRLKVKVGGGHGGHNGLRSLHEQVGEAYVRVRCGVGKPSGGKDKVTGHVLGGFSKEESKEVPFLVGGAADAVELIMVKGTTAAMNKVNTGEAPRS
jgi:peptidyl-tRNA hydrolase, PTH1 family